MGGWDFSGAVLLNIVVKKIAINFLKVAFFILKFVPFLVLTSPLP
jgi:hypothetical protein